MKLTLDAVLSYILGSLNQYSVNAGHVDVNGDPKYVFFGEHFTMPNYDWRKSLIKIDYFGRMKAIPVIPTVLVRDSSLSSTGSQINTCFNSFTLHIYIKPDQVNNIRLVLEDFIRDENDNNAIASIEGYQVLKSYESFSIDDEAFLGAPDGESRHRLTLEFTLDAFDDGLVTSADFELRINDVTCEYLSWRFEKAHMMLSNEPNDLNGKSLYSVDYVHEFGFTVELFWNEENPSVQTIRNELFSYTEINRSYKVELLFKGNNILAQRNMIIAGSRTQDVPPQIQTFVLTFEYEHKRAGVRVRTDSGTYTDLPVYAFAYVYNAQPHTATYFGSNVVKNTKVGIANGWNITFPMVEGDPLIEQMVHEVFSEVSDNTYWLEITYFGRTYEYPVILVESRIETDNAAYDLLSVAFVRAR